MPYREPSTPRTRVVHYGPFPRRKIEAIVGPIGGILLLFVAIAMLRAERLECTRASGMCTYGHDSIVFGKTGVTIPIDSVVERRWVETRDKSREKGQTSLVTRSGRQVDVFSTSRADARGIHARIEEFFRDASRPTLEIRGDTPFGAFAFVGVLAIFSLFLGASAWRTPSSIRLAIDGDRLRVVRRWLGVPLRSQSFACSPTDAVEVERGSIKFFTQRSYEAPVPAGRLILVGRDRRVPLTDRMCPGEEVHERAQRELAAALRDEDPPVERADEPVLSTAVPWHTRRGVRIAGSLAGIIGVSAILQGLLMWHANRTQGWLEVSCDGRCRMGGGECLPGGAWSGSFDPGEHAIEVWNPSAPNHWERALVRIEIGKTTRFRCLAGASAKVTGPSD